MRKISLSLLTAVTVAIGALSISVPTQAAAATTITPNVNDTMLYKSFTFDSYPPSWYADEEGFSGDLKQVTAYPDGTYIGVYYGSYSY
ncbi:MAG: hypothetical protein ACXVP5_08290 [Tumebacillaceae bacterium]